MDRDPNFFQYFVKQTNESLQELRKSMARMEDRLSDLIVLKAEMTRDAKWKSWMISSGLGILTLVVTTGITIWLSERERKAILNEGLGPSPKGQTQHE